MCPVPGKDTQVMVPADGLLVSDQDYILPLLGLGPGILRQRDEPVSFPNVLVAVGA